MEPLFWDKEKKLLLAILNFPLIRRSPKIWLRLIIGLYYVAIIFNITVPLGILPVGKFRGSWLCNSLLITSSLFLIVCMFCGFRYLKYERKTALRTCFKDSILQQIKL